MKLKVIWRDELSKNQRDEPTIKTDKNTLVIVDEADNLFLDYNCTIEGKGPIIGFTATSVSTMLDCEYMYMFNKLQFSFLDSGMTNRVAE